MEQNDFQNPKKRAFLGKLSGIIGILCNVLLAAGKLITGSLSASVSIMADGLNNLSDAASSVVTLVGFKLAEKPADREHPYGHARFEYLAGLTVAVMILVIGFELAKGSVNKVLHPEAIEFSLAAVIVLILSIFVKTGMMLFNQSMGKKIHSETLIATAADSRNDVITTAAVLLAALAEHFFNWKIDGIMGIIVSLFILYSGIMLARKTISPLLGEGANSALQKELVDYVNSCPTVLGCHDLMVHDYGPGRRYASIHVEIDRKEDAIQSHEIIDKIERDCLKEYGVHLVVHYDPVITDDSEMNRIHRIVEKILKVRDDRLSIHDFRMQSEHNCVQLEFDVMLPAELQGEEASIQTALEEALNSMDDSTYHTEIIFDLDTGC